LRLCVIGPTYPFRGGIAHYTTLLVQNLRRAHEVNFYSYIRQYPSLLFPGSTEKDPSKQILKVDCEYILDPFNPWTWFKTFERIREDEPDALILQWWAPFWTPTLTAISYLIKRFTPIEILFICHHVTPPDGGPFDFFLAKRVLASGDHFIVLSEEDYRRLRRGLPEADIRLAAHPTYDIFNRNSNIDKLEARRWLGISEDERLILFFGFVRRYKGLPYLLKAMPSVLQRIKVHLLIVGEFWESERAYRRAIERLGLNRSVTVLNKYVPNEEVGLYFSAADVVVLPYLEATQSGVVQLAYGFEKPVITTTVGGLTETVSHGRTGLIVPPRDSEALAEAIIRFFEDDLAADLIKGIRERQNDFSWTKLVKLIEEMLSR